MWVWILCCLVIIAAITTYIVENYRHRKFIERMILYMEAVERHKSFLKNDEQGEE